MDYEKAYKESFEAAKGLYDAGNALTKKQREIVFPQLAESEDERIKKALIDGVRQIRCKNGITQEQMIAYLEKQKEAKWSPSEAEMGVLYKLCYVSNQITDEDDTELTRLYQDLKREYFNGHSFENMFSNEKQKEQKKSLSERFRPDFPAVADFIESVDELEKNMAIEIPSEKQKEQKPIQTDAEKEYVRTLKSLISDFLRGKEEVDREYYQKIFDWLDRRHIEQNPAEWILPEEFEEAVYKVANFISPFDSQEELRKVSHRFAEQLLSLAKKELDKPAEWSEEDEEVMEDLYNFVISDFIQDHIHETRWKPWKTTLERNRQNRLKSIRPVSKESLQSWKPSEEQMDTLLNTEGMVRQSGYRENAKVLASLYEDLKKL